MLGTVTTFEYIAFDYILAVTKENKINEQHVREIEREGGILFNNISTFRGYFMLKSSL